ncbi:class I SAM-dependent DNA methyltransferase [Macromonas bipunctata]|uniref:class I SAM-dependent DNA methyltransferase n=1 Tax=Macromonas bipunctata TaxID=183670 RepID=UPI000C31CEF0|nr:DNA methyltransferase [Macromonas bipunctata]
MNKTTSSPQTARRRKAALAAPLSTVEIRKRLTAFVHSWQAVKDEKADAQTFTLRLLECYGLNEHNYLREGRVPKLGGATGYMDGFIPGKLIIEFKSLGKNLKKAATQALGYHWGLPPEQQPRHLLLCDFETFVLIDLAQQTQATWQRADLPRHADKLRFLIDDAPGAIVEERDADRKAAYQLARLHEGLLRVNFTGRPLELFLTRTLFCLFADDTGLFGDNGQFHRFLQGSRGDGDDLGPRLAQLYQTLNKPEHQRQTNLDDAYARFPYVNGSLFADLSEVPSFDSDLRQALMACAEIDWKDISPAIFGAMFQGVLEADPDAAEATTRHKANKARRRDLGAHYTSERHILRAINPLFMDALRAEFKAAGKDADKLDALLRKLPTLHLFDPACGCGNFLVIAYRELRLLELDIIERRYKAKNTRQGALLALADYARVSPDQLHGIEIEDSAAHIARVAILITDHQINEQSRHIGLPRPTIPLGKMPNIVCANALATDWASVVAPQRCTYIVGNPPFVGYSNQNPQQKAELARACVGVEGAGVLDYVAAWHVTATRYMAANPAVRAALVSTNSITQGEQVAVLWRWMHAQGVKIEFAHRTFQWSNEGLGVAAVHCVIVGFGLQERPDKLIFEYDDIKGEPKAVPAQHINPYLIDAPTVFIDKRRKPLCVGVPEMVKGSQPTDGGHLLLLPEAADALRASDPIAAKYLRRFLGADEFLNNLPRYCLWLKDSTATDRRDSPEIRQRMAAVQAMRQASPKLPTQKLAEVPYLFGEIRQTAKPYLLIPSVSSENRKFVPIGYLTPDVIASNLVFMLPDATLYHFGVLCSTMHNAWLRTVCGRLKSDFRYSNTIVYNNFVWPHRPTAAQVKAVERAAQAVLEARAAEERKCAEQGQTCSLAALYPTDATMPAELLKAHQQLDKAVDAAYGYKPRKDGTPDEAHRVAFLFGLYQALLHPLDQG